MRAVLAAILIAFSLPAFAQTPAPANPAPSATMEATTARIPRGGAITRDEYIERARRAAERRFDRMDTNHDGVLTADERRAAREERAARRAARSQAQPQ
jgi:hypothetical protein